MWTLHLCFKCATLPTLVRHKYDDHPLSLCYRLGNVNSTYCCGVCEEEVYPKSGFYWCSDCNSTLHIPWIQFSDTRPKKFWWFELLLIDSISRPTCYVCKTRCLGIWLGKIRQIQVYSCARLVAFLSINRIIFINFL